MASSKDAGDGHRPAHPHDHTRLEAERLGADVPATQTEIATVGRQGWRDELAGISGMDHLDAVLFDLDGVVTDTASLHAAAWADTFDPFLEHRAREQRSALAPFTPEDYLAFVDGRPRLEGVRSFLKSRGIKLPEGKSSDGPDSDTVHGLGAHKNQAFLSRLKVQGIQVYPSTMAVIERLRGLGIRTGLVTASRNSRRVLNAARIEALFDVIIDGETRAALNLRGKPAPDTYLEAAQRLGTAPSRTAVVEDSTAGVAAARAGGFGLVIGIDRGQNAEALKESGADLVVQDLSELATSQDTERNGYDIHTQADQAGGIQADAPNPAGGRTVDPWVLTFDAFDPAVEGRRETLLALGNGYFVTRGAAAESSADGVHYPGTYLAGGYNRLTTKIESQAVEHEDLVNLPNWLPFTFRSGEGEWTDIRAMEKLSHHVSLDLRSGVYRRTMLLRDANGRETQIVERRIVHIQEKHLGAQEFEVTARNWSGPVEFRVHIDGAVTNAGVIRYEPFNGAHLKVLKTSSMDAETILLEAETTQSRLRMALAARIRLASDGKPIEVTRSAFVDDQSVGQLIVGHLDEGHPIQIEKIVALCTSRDRASADTASDARTALRRAPTFADLLESHVRTWHHLWRRCDIEAVRVEGDPDHDVHLITRLHIFHLLQTISPHTRELDAGVPARGWHGEAYRGHIFWDELFIFPFLSLRMPELTRALLLYRYRRLGEARWAARAAGFRGAMFPWQSGSNGREETDKFFLNPRSGNWIKDDTHLQRHVGAAVAYNVWRYHQATGDSEFLYAYGAELLLEIARFWTSIAKWNDTRECFDICGVIGPDEFHDRYPGAHEPGLTNNTYTNVMASWCITRALDLFKILPAERCRELCERLEIHEDELADWRRVSEKLYLPFLSEGVLSQFEGYDALEEFDWTAYRTKYGQLRRLDLILEAEGLSPNRYKLAKQADALMLFYLFSAEELAEIFGHLGHRFDGESIPRTIEYYLRRTSHGSTLSGVTHAWVLARSCRRQSWQLFTEALRSDVEDIQGGTTREGIHLGAMAGTLDLLQRCYTGLELRNSQLRFHPVLPDQLSELSFRMRYRKHSLVIVVTPTRLTITSETAEAAPVELSVDEQTHLLEAGSTLDFALEHRVNMTSAGDEG